MKRIIAHHDFLNAVINDQQTITSAKKIEEKDAAYFILSADGTSIVIKDINGNTIYTVAGTSFKPVYPLRLEDGFEVTGSNINVLFCKVKY